MLGPLQRAETWPVNPKFFDLNRAPYVLYGVKYIDLVSLDVDLQGQSQILTSLLFFFNTVVMAS